MNGTPTRAFFEQLSFFATDEEQKEKLLELSSAVGCDITGVGVVSPQPQRFL